MSLAAGIRSSSIGGPAHMDTGKSCGDSAAGGAVNTDLPQGLTADLTNTKPLPFMKSRSPSPPPSSDSLSNLHRVTDMLKEKVNCNNSTIVRKDATISTAAGDAVPDRVSPTPGSDAVNRKSPYLADPSSAKPVHGCIQKMESCFPLMGASHHRMSMLLGADRYGHHNDSSNVLRGILQGKERALVTGNNILEHESRVAKRFSDMYACLPPENDIKNGSIGDNSDVDSFRSRSPGDSYDDSDPDRRMNGVSDMDDIIGENKDSYRDSYLEGNEDQNSNRSECASPKEKKIHVENAVSSSVNSSPSGKFNIDDLVTPPERRPKRKQYIPQQHGSVDQASSEPMSKVRRVEKEILQKQLKQMQQQLAIMQHRYVELFDHGEDISDLECTSKDNGERQKSMAKFSQFGSPLSIDFDPSHFIKQASNLVHEQELMSKCQTSPLSGKTPSDIAHLTRMLKDEITHGVGTLVDTAVAKFVEKNQKHSPRPSSSSIVTSTPAPPVDKPKKERSTTPVEGVSKAKSPCPRNVHHNNNNNNNTKDMSVKMSQSLSSSSNFMMHERLTTPKPPRTKVTDKISHPFFDFHPKPFGDIARAHPALFPPPPYFPTQIPPIQPLYAKEPEQTEALSLVLGTPTKKKKVPTATLR